MAADGTGKNRPGAPKAPNLVLRRIREQERHETREEFADAMARVAREMGASVYPDAKYVARLETGDIRCPRPLYRSILSQLCGRPFSALGFSPPPGLSLPGDHGSRHPGPANADGVAPAKRMNVALRGAVMASGLEVPQIARKVGVDPKSVQRWITRGVVPHPRHRWKTCEILGCDESELWSHESGSRKESQASGAYVGTDQNVAQQASPAIAELCAALTDYGFGLDQFASLPRDMMPSLQNLERDLEVVFSAYQQSRFSAAASRVSMLLTDAQVAARECKATERARVLRVLALSYQAAASLLTKGGQPDISWIAAERGLNAAEASGMPAVRLSLIRSVAFALLSTGRFESAIRLVESGAGSLESEITEDDTGLSVYGTLFLAGSMAAARFGDGSRTAEYLREADSAASRLGKDANHLWTAFGPTNVAIHRVNTAVELGDIQTVLDYGLSLNTKAVPTERRVRYLLDVARAHSLIGNQEGALGALLTAERLAPEQVRQHYLTRKVITALIKSAIGRPSVELDKLAARVNGRDLI
ncbi:MAG: hypothetical protein JOY82_01140 [Streptosporangiaceae bacterium]|nr:hypothetical protein [Streptosporangiaceae bacterium]